MMIRCLVAAFLCLSFMPRGGYAAGCDEAGARKIAELAIGRMRELFGEPAPAPEIALYPTEESLRGALGLPKGTPISGRYEPKSGKVHVACVGAEEGLFERSLRHETAHYYIDRVFGQIPPALDEGVAAYMEEGSFEEGIAGEHINQARLREFRVLLQRGRAPGLKELLSTAGGSPFSSADYASSWAFVFVMLHNSDPLLQAGRREILRSLLFLKGRKEDYYRLFRERILASEGLPEKWESAWRREIWSLKNSL
jgi:hypothetical protein